MVTNMKEQECNQFLTILKNNSTNNTNKKEKLKKLTLKQTQRINEYFEKFDKETKHKNPDLKHLARYTRNLRNYLYRTELEVPNDLREKITKYDKRLINLYMLIPQKLK